MRSFVGSRLGLLLSANGLSLSTSLRDMARAVDPAQIWLSHKVVLPTSTVQINGNGFGQVEAVYLDCDTTQLGTVTTDATGKFVTQMTVPKTALPGAHTVLATGQGSGLTAQAFFLVQADWIQ